ncbi:MAG: hypothetical protein HQK60_05160 [Deltaproteobacteria bacterium]|nr:hypothetical protein [Deltaproteobacteria bacterium]
MAKIFIWSEEVGGWVCLGYAHDDDVDAFTKIGCVVVYSKYPRRRLHMVKGVSRALRTALTLK